MTYDSEYYYAVQTFLEDDELCKIWNIIEIAIRDLALGVWEADNEDDMIDEITTATGWCIKNIYYDIQLK